MTADCGDEALRSRRQLADAVAEGLAEVAGPVLRGLADQDDGPTPDLYALFAQLAALRQDVHRLARSHAPNVGQPPMAEVLPPFFDLRDHLARARDHAAAAGAGRRWWQRRNLRAQGEAVAFTGALGALDAALGRLSIVPFAGRGDAFDPVTMAAVGSIEDAGVGAGRVAQIVRCGFRDGPRVLRSAEVVVSHLASAPEAAQ